MRSFSTSSSARTTCSKWKRVPCIRPCSGCSKRNSSGPSGPFRLQPTVASASTKSPKLACSTSKVRSLALTGCSKASRWYSGLRDEPRLHRSPAMSWLERIFRRRHLYDELGDEVREHIEEKTEQLMRLESLSRAEARQAALRAFGNPTLVQTRSRDVWQWSRLESLLADLKLALRRLRKSPGFAITVLLTLAIGIGANTTVFSVFENVLLKPLAY